MAGKSDWERLKARLDLEESEVRHERQLNHWLDEAVREFEKRGGMEHVEGKGKPLAPPAGDPLDHVLKTANVKPPWLELRHEIRDGLRELALRAGSGAADGELLMKDLAAINEKIGRYNALVPHYSLQKMKVRPETISEQAKTWE